MMFKFGSISALIGFLIYFFWGVIDWIFSIFTLGIGVPIIGGICFAVVMWCLKSNVVDRGGKSGF